MSTVHIRSSLPALLALCCAAILFAAGLRTPKEDRVLVFSKTESFRHASIETGIEAIRQLGNEHGFGVDATEDAAMFTENTLKNYRAVIFLNTTGDVLDPAQQDEFERFIQAGGGYVGVHAATDTEYDWPWYGKLAGAYFESHPNNPNVRTGVFRTLRKDHPSTEGLPDRWEREDEFYNFHSINPDIEVLIDIDETTYEGGTNGEHHPMSWHHAFDGGRAWYTAMGHTDETYAEPLFLQHLLGGIRYAMGTEALDYDRARPQENRFAKVVLADKLAEPMELAVLPDERVLFIERGGAVHLYRRDTEEITQIATIPVSTQYLNGNVAEDGLLGVAADPGFAENGWIYLFYSPAGDDPKNVLARYRMEGDNLDLDTEQVILEVAVQRDECCHTGGSMDFDADGNLYLSTGDNTNPNATGYAAIDERPGRGPWDAQKSSGNTNDLRGKILRIAIQPDGTYAIPEGNLFPPGAPDTRPEIYTMGHRNPFRISVDHRTGFLYWGDIGPDASRDSVDRGPVGYDEFNQARQAGNYGWPYVTGDNKPYYDYDFVTKTPGAVFDPARLTNDSPNNTGLAELPPAQPAFLWYPSGPSAEFPLLGSGGRSAMAGPVFYRDDFADAERPFPAWYDGKLFLYEWMRGWIMAVTMSEAGDFLSMERFMPSYRFSNPMDMAFAPSGDLYLLEYGTAWFSANDDARLVRIEYNAGNRPPAVQVAADRPAGATPLRVALSSEGTVDADGDALRYAWTITGPDGTVLEALNEPNPAYTFEEAGVYGASLTVTDAQGASTTAETRILAGNEPPEVEIDLAEGNRSFFFPGTPIRYAVRVRDHEDGSLQDGQIAAENVAVSADYLREGYDLVAIAQGHRAADASAAHAAGRTLVEGETCLACHQVDRASIGPSYMAVAERYEGGADAAERLTTNILEGSSGVWGEMAMPPHPQLSENEAQQMVEYILSLAEESDPPASLPVEGTYMPPGAGNGPVEGIVTLRAAYTDQGANGLPGASSEETLVLRAPTVVVADGELGEGIMKFASPQFPTPMTVVLAPDSYVRLAQIDLTGISEVRFLALTPTQLQAQGGKVEIRLDAPDGRLVGETGFIEPEPSDIMQGGAGPSPTSAPLEPATGMHDVYLTFRNEEHGGQGGLFVLMTAEFVRGDAPATNMPDAPENSAQQPPEHDAAAGLSTQSPMRDILAHEGARAVLDKYVPGMAENPQLQQALHMSLREIAPYAPQTFTEELLEAIEADLAEL